MSQELENVISVYKELAERKKFVEKFIIDLLAKRDQIETSLQPLEDKISEFKKEIEMIDEELKIFMTKTELETLSIARYNLAVKPKIIANVKSWEALHSWIKSYKGDEDVFGLIKRDIHTKNFEKFYESKNIIPDGVEINTIEKFSVTKSRKKEALPES